MASKRSPAAIVVAVLVASVAALAGWWIWDGERRASRSARRAHAAGARSELAQQLRFAENYSRALAACRKARERGDRAPKLCDEAVQGADQIEADTRRAEKAYLEACAVCATEETCARDVKALKAGQAAPGPPCD